MLVLILRQGSEKQKYKVSKLRLLKILVGSNIKSYNVNISTGLKCGKGNPKLNVFRS